MKTSLQRLCLIVATLVCLSEVVAHAKTSAMGTLKGVVTDPNGVPFGGPLVRIVYSGLTHKRQPAEKEMVAHTDANGQFTVKLAPGIYDLFVSQPGFLPVAEQVKLETGKETVFDPKLKPGRFAEIVY
jgi:carboxypeptidase family protein